MSVAVSQLTRSMPTATAQFYRPTPRSDFESFARMAVRLRDEPFSFEGRPYLHAVYAAAGRRLVLRASRQVEKSTLLCNRILFDAVRMPGRQILFVSPRDEQSRLF